MHLKPTVCAGLAVAALMAMAPALPVSAAGRMPAKSARKAPAKSSKSAKSAKFAKPVKPVASATAVGRTPSETVSRLIAAMRRRDKTAIATAFNWTRFAGEMNKLIPDGKGLDAGTYKTLLVETLDVEPSVSNNLRVGQETKKGPDTATVEMRRVFPSGSGKSGTTQIRTINVLSLGKERDGWKIFRLDSVQQATPAAAPPVPRAPQGMVPAAGSKK